MIPSADIGDVLSSPVWTVLATLLAAAAIWVSIWLYRRQRSRKSLAYEIKTTSLVSVHSAAKGRIKIFFDDEEIQKVHLVEARLENTGNMPVLAADFDQPIRFDLGEGATPLTVDATKISPPDLAARVNLNNSEVELLPLLLNPGDGLTLKILARNLNDEVKCHYRIVGIAKMQDGAQQRQLKGQRAILKRWLNALDAPFGSVATAALGGVGVVAVLVSLTNGNPSSKTETTVRLTNGETLCGKVLETSDRRVVVQLAGSGNIRPLPLREVKSIKDDSC